MRTSIFNSFFSLILKESSFRIAQSWFPTSSGNVNLSALSIDLSRSIEETREKKKKKKPARLNIPRLNCM